METANSAAIAKRLGGMVFANQANFPTAITVSPQILQQYVGRYQMADNAPTEDVAIEGDHLKIVVSGEGEVGLIAVGKDEFVMEDDADIRFHFNRDARGNVESYAFKTPRGERLLKRLSLPAASLQGNTTFRLKGFADAKVVNLAGTFNDWKPAALVCGKENGEWVCRLDLKPGKYLYKFIVDGIWMIDPDNSKTEDDGQGNTNSVLVKGN
jgi:hypothetical protein